MIELPIKGKCLSEMNENELKQNVLLKRLFNILDIDRRELKQNKTTCLSDYIVT